MNDHTPHGRQDCGARTRKGGSCRRLADPTMPGGGRCNLHGGKSFSGSAHPRFKHGRYSKYTAEGRREAAERERRRRERARKREDSYVDTQLSRWVARQGAWYNFERALALIRRWRREYREQEAQRAARPTPAE